MTENNTTVTGVSMSDQAEYAELVADLQGNFGSLYWLTLSNR